MSIRLVVNVDVQTNDINKAYEVVAKAFDKICKTSQFTTLPMTWETSDEWYDENGEPGDVRLLNEASAKVWGTFEEG